MEGIYIWNQKWKKNQKRSENQLKKSNPMKTNCFYMSVIELIWKQQKMICGNYYRHCKGKEENGTGKDY